jgi:TolA-binding protein
LTALEREMADILRQSEENGHRLVTMETALTRLRSDQEERLATLERKVQESAAASPPLVADSSGTPVVAPPRATQPAGTPAAKPTPSAKPTLSAKPTTASAAPADDPGEAAYSEGFRLWEAGSYSQAIASLRSVIAAYPKHRRVSFANNLIGRSLLDSNQPRAAAEALLANYRSNPKGERAPDSLYYLGQSLMKLGQPSQACKAYAELQDVYGGKIRPELAGLLPAAKAQAGCS